jgi:hypothetical protein
VRPGGEFVSNIDNEEDALDFLNENFLFCGTYEEGQLWVDKNNTAYFGNTYQEIVNQYYDTPTLFSDSIVAKDYESWRKQVYKRDNYACRTCGSKENIHAHHKYGRTRYPQYALCVDNGITLCKTCHKGIHAYRNRYYRIKGGGKNK